jgi:hypothetical protein
MGLVDPEDLEHLETLAEGLVQLSASAMHLDAIEAVSIGT